MKVKENHVGVQQKEADVENLKRQTNQHETFPFSQQFREVKRQVHLPSTSSWGQFELFGVQGPWSVPAEVLPRRQGAGRSTHLPAPPTHAESLELSMKESTRPDLGKLTTYHVSSKLGDRSFVESQ